MQAVVKTPHIEIAVNGRIPKRLLTVLKEEYGAAVRILQDEDEHMVDVFQSEWYRGIKEKLTPGTNMRAYRENRDMTQIELGRLPGAGSHGSTSQTWREVLGQSARKWPSSSPRSSRFPWRSS